VSKRRSILVWSLVGVSTLLLLVSSMTVWTKRQLLDTDNWSDTSSQLLADDEVRGALAQRLVDGLSQRYDLQADLKERLPPNLQPVVPVLAASVQSAAVRAADRLLASPRVQELWKEANRGMHRILVKVLDGDSEIVKSTGGNVVLDLRPIVDRLAERLGVEDRLAKVRESGAVPPGEIVIMKSDQLDAAQKAVRVIKVFSIFFLILVLGLYAVAVYLAQGRRRGVLLGIGACVTGVGLLLLIVQRVVGNAIIESLVKVEANKEPSNHVWLIATELLRDLAAGLVIWGLLLVLGAILAGPSRPARAVRRWLTPTFRERPWIVYLVALTAFLMLIAWGPNANGRRWIGVLILAALVALGIEALRRVTLREAGDHEAVAPPPPPPPAGPAAPATP
jgi:hypothetical protein